MNRLLIILILGLSMASCTEDGPNSSDSSNPFINMDGLTNGEYTGNGNQNQGPGLQENPFIDVNEESQSTFSIDADGAAYANMRREIQQNNQLPEDFSIRTEEFINYFDMAYTFEDNGHPIDLNGELSSCPWDEEHKLLRVGIQGAPIPPDSWPLSNYVLLVDVSGSMAPEDRLGLLKKGFIELLESMRPEDRVAIVTYAGSSEVVLESTSVSDKQVIISAINSLSSGGSTAGAAGIIDAYRIAEENFVTRGNNRLIVGTDGNFNVGISDQESLVNLIEEKRELGIFLTIVGVGSHYAEASLEQIANHGNGTFEYVDNIQQLEKVFIHEFSKFLTVAKDVKVQLNFNPLNVKSYRLIGYENRLLDNEDFEDDKVDAGEIGADQNITALYEIIPAESNSSLTQAVDVLFRYKDADGDFSQELHLEIFDENQDFLFASDAMQLSAVLASFGMLLLDSEYKGFSNYELLKNWIELVQLEDEHGYIEELRTLIYKASAL